MATAKKMTGRKKAAVLFITLGPELSSSIMRQLPEEEIEKISYEIANLDLVDSEKQVDVIEEFLELHQAQFYLLKGGVEYAKQVLEKTVGAAKANEYLRKLSVASKKQPFSCLRKTDPKHLVNFIGSEHPQTIALILSYLDPEQAAMVLGALPQEKQADIAKRVATMDTTAPEIVKEVEMVLDQKISTVVDEKFAYAGGV